LTLSLNHFYLCPAILAAGAPHIAPFMADEVLLSLPEIDCLDYTMKEYMRMVEYVKTTVDRLNKMVGEGERIIGRTVI
jgi:hypothetical protein